MRVKLTLGALLASLIAASAALAAGGPMSGKTVKIGVIADSSGPAGAYGTSQRSALELAAEDLAAGRIDAGGAKLEFDIEDSASDPAQVVNLMQKFTTDGSALLIGPTLSSEAKKADPIAVKANLTILAISNTAQGITSMGPCVFRNSLAEEQVVPEALAKVEAKWKVKTAAIIYGDDDQFTKTDYDVFKAALAAHHVDVVDTETYHKGDIDFKAQLLKIDNKHPDLLVVGALVEDAAKILVQSAQVGLKAHAIGGNGLNSPQLAALAGPAANGVVVGTAYFVGSSNPMNVGFVGRYKKKYDKNPDQFAAQAYAAAQIVAATVKAGASASASICDGFAKLKAVPTVLGPVGFEPSRDVHAPSAILQIENGKYVPFE